jgi:hypothetical protein
MSLLATASIWSNNENKKRVSSIRKQKKNQFISDDIEHMNNPSDEKPKVPSLEEMKTLGEERSSRVTELLNEMEEDDEDDKMGSFQPIQPPQLNVKKEMEKVKESKEYVAPQYSYKEGASAMRNNKLVKEEYSADNRKNSVYSNYNQSYEAPKVVEPYYSKMGITGSTNDKLLEKMNYLVHMMEEQHNEKTSHITEEFILYTFLGVFIIFVVDSFNRTQKYVR